MNLTAVIWCLHLRDRSWRSWSVFYRQWKLCVYTSYALCEVFVFSIFSSDFCCRTYIHRDLIRSCAVRLPRVCVTAKRENGYGVYVISHKKLRCQDDDSGQSDHVRRKRTLRGAGTSWIRKWLQREDVAGVQRSYMTFCLPVVINVDILRSQELVFFDVSRKY